MRRWSRVSVLVLATVLSSGWASAQTDEEDRYREDEADVDRFALGVGVGLVEPLNEVETYFMASLRIQVSGRKQSSERNGESWRGRDPRGEGITGYLEPEIGYWESSADGVDGSDLLAGINLVGVVPLGSVDSFFGVGAGVHFIDASLLEGNPANDDSETKFGANAQFGLDLYITENLSAFGTGRFDLVQGSEDSIQSKVYLGLRCRF
jgi:hypothetical protein